MYKSNYTFFLVNSFPTSNTKIADENRINIIAIEYVSLRYPNNGAITIINNDVNCDSIDKTLDLLSF